MTDTSLVTGGAGFIGAHVSRRLLDAGYEVIVVDDLSGGDSKNVPDGAELIEVSVLDAERMEALFAERGFRYVYHLAAYAAEGLSHFIRNFNYRNNVVGSINITNASIRHKVERLVYTSSIAVYGSNQIPMHEGLAPEPEDPYGIAKYAVEMDLRAARQMFGLEYTVFRPHNVYGEYQNLNDPYRNVIGIFMRQILKGQPITIFGDGEQTRAFSYVDDAVIPMIECLGMPETASEIFNVGADQAYSVNQLSTAIMAAMSMETEIVHLEARDEVVHAVADHSKIHQAFSGLTDSMVLKNGLRRMADWAKTQKLHPPKPFTGIEIEEELPQSWRKLMSTE
jgi:UDP-glucose 4-epimerase